MCAMCVCVWVQCVLCAIKSADPGSGFVMQVCVHAGHVCGCVCACVRAMCAASTRTALAARCLSGRQLAPTPALFAAVFVTLRSD